MNKATKVLSNFSQILLSAMQNKSWHYWMMQYSQLWFKNMWINCQNTVIHELWPKRV